MSNNFKQNSSNTQWMSVDLFVSCTHYDDDVEVDPKDWIMAETDRKTRMLTGAVKECEKVRRERIAFAEKLKELEHRDQYTAAVLGNLQDGQQCTNSWLFEGEQRFPIACPEEPGGGLSVSKEPAERRLRQDDHDEVMLSGMNDAEMYQASAELF